MLFNRHKSIKYIKQKICYNKCILKKIKTNFI